MRFIGGGWLARIFLQIYELTFISTIEGASESYPVVLVMWLGRVVD